jgi:hypothetical protein
MNCVDLHSGKQLKKLGQKENGVSAQDHWTSAQRFHSAAFNRNKGNDPLKYRKKH